MVEELAHAVGAKKMKKLLGCKKKKTAEKASERRRYFTHERFQQRKYHVWSHRSRKAESFGEEQVSLTASDV